MKLFAICTSGYVENTNKYWGNRYANFVALAKEMRVSGEFPALSLVNYAYIYMHVKKGKFERNCGAASMGDTTRQLGLELIM